MSPRYLALAALGVVASVIIPAVSHAQLGGLTKKASKAAASAAGVPTGNERYVKKIDLTSAQLAQVNKGLESAVKTGPETIKRWEKAQEANDKEQEGYNKAMDEYNKKHEKWDACVNAEKEKAQAKLDAASKKTGQASDKLQQGIDTTSMMAQAQAAQAAAERVKNGTATAADRQTMADFQKTMGGVSSNSNAVTAAVQENSALQQAVADSIKKKCGEEPQPPAKGAGSKGAKAGVAAPTSAAEEINQTSAAAAGMSEDEYRKAKEKAMGYAASNTQVQGGSDTPDDEAKAINAALAETRSLMTQATKANVPL